LPHSLALVAALLNKGCRNHYQLLLHGYKELVETNYYASAEFLSVIKHQISLQIKSFTEDNFVTKSQE